MIWLQNSLSRQTVGNPTITYQVYYVAGRFYRKSGTTRRASNYTPMYHRTPPLVEYSKA